MGLSFPCSLQVRCRLSVVLLSTCFAFFAVGLLSVVLELYAILHTAYQIYHTIHESMALIFYNVRGKI